ncbi:CBS domain-containing protein [Teichococcus oryzae]|nr:CBS domain-containing protein [Pseudoroseomonas oryzae]
MATPHARDLMSADVKRIPPETPVAAVARMFANQGISTVAVSDETGRLLGVVTESDLIRRLANEDKPARSGWLARMFADDRSEAQRYIQSHGATAGDVMSTQVVTVGPEETAFHIARLMEEHRIRRVLVVEDGRILGLVSRSDLVRVLVTAEPLTPDQQSDEGIRKAVVAAMRQEPWADTAYIDVKVRDGIVEFHGFRRSATEYKALHVLAQNVPGVKGVQDNTRSLPGYFAE